MNWINVPGMSVVVLMLLPNIIYAFICKGDENQNRCHSFLMNLVEQIGRYGSMFLMAFNIGVLESGFSSKAAFLSWLFTIALLMLGYWVCWVLYFKKRRRGYALALAILPSLMFLLSGILQRHWLLSLSAVLFSAGHIHVTVCNAWDDAKS
ncbi:MAG: hypothetical protein SPD11_12220 [Sphaerochaetaceae bacterium]|nr:hypothetical protein [Sphaerochaetaceae bacterium]